MGCCWRLLFMLPTSKTEMALRMSSKKLNRMGVYSQHTTGDT